MFEGNTVHIQPRRSDLTSDMESVTSITHLSMFILLIYLLLPRRPLQPLGSDITSDLDSVTLITNKYMYLHIAYMVWTLGTPGGHQTVLEVKSGLRHKLSAPHY